VAIAADLERVRLVRALQRVASGEAAALEDIYRRTSAKLFGVILRILGDRNEAEDVLQEVFVTVWNRAGSYDPTRGVSPITWLAAVARNRAIDRIRSRAARPTQPLEAAAEVVDGAARPGPPSRPMMTLVAWPPVSMPWTRSSPAPSAPPSSTG